MTFTIELQAACTAYAMGRPLFPHMRGTLFADIHVQVYEGKCVLCPFHR